MLTGDYCTYRWVMCKSELEFEFLGSIGTLLQYISTHAFIGSMNHEKKLIKLVNLLMGS